MSELKDYKVYTTRHEGAWGYHYEPNPNKDQSDIELNGEQVYLKKDADKVIAHHKRKRCLAMAEWCNSEMGRETFACFRPRNTKEVWREEHKYWAKWRKIWFGLYKKFKEAK
jgi:hypothetical protein